VSDLREERVWLNLAHPLRRRRGLAGAAVVC